MTGNETDNWFNLIFFSPGWDQSCDVWSVGCIIFELAMGFMMFDTHSSQVSSHWSIVCQHLL